MPSNEVVDRQVLTVREVEDLTSLKRVTLWRLERRGDFPIRINLTGKKVGWFKREIDAWLDKRLRGIGVGSENLNAGNK